MTRQMTYRAGHKAAAKPSKTEEGARAVRLALDAGAELYVSTAKAVLHCTNRPAYDADERLTPAVVEALGLDKPYSGFRLVGRRDGAAVYQAAGYLDRQAKAGVLPALEAAGYAVTGREEFAGMLYLTLTDGRGGVLRVEVK